MSRRHKLDFSPIMTGVASVGIKINPETGYAEYYKTLAPGIRSDRPVLVFRPTSSQKRVILSGKGGVYVRRDQIVSGFSHVGMSEDPNIRLQQEVKRQLDDFDWDSQREEKVL